MVGEAGRPGGQRCSVMTAAVVGVGGLALAWPPSAQVSSVVLLCVHPSGRRLRVHLSTPLRLSVRAYSERETGWLGGGGGGAEPTLPSRGPIKDVTSLEIVYAACHVHRLVCVAM